MRKKKLTQTSMHAWGGAHEIWELSDEKQELSDGNKQTKHRLSLSIT